MTKQKHEANDNKVQAEGNSLLGGGGGHTKGLECWAENSATLHFQHCLSVKANRDVRLGAESESRHRLLGHCEITAKFSFGLHGAEIGRDAFETCVHLSLSLCHTSSFSPTEKNGRSFTNQKFDLLRMG